MDHTIGLRYPQPPLPAPAGGAGQAKVSPAPQAPPTPKAPAGPAQPRPAVYIELFDDNLRPGQQHAVPASARAAPANAPPNAPPNAPVVQVANLEPGPKIEPETRPETLEAAPRRDIGGAGPEHWQRERVVDDVPQVELTLDDVLDIINPLQHIPLVSSIYRSVTGDQITGSARIIGDTLFGGPIGFVASLVNAITEEVSGRDLGANVLAALIGDDDGELTAPEVQTAAATGGAAHDPDAPGDLSGRAALEAYVDDLRSIGRGGAPSPISARPPALISAEPPALISAEPPAPARPPPAAQTTVPVPPGAIRGAQAANPPFGPSRSLAGVDPALFATLQASASAAPGGGIGGFDTIRPGAAFPDRLREALDKYQAISGARATNDDRRLDKNL